MKVALLPTPQNPDERGEEEEGERMHNLTKQLPHVSFDVLLEKGDNAGEILHRALGELELDPVVTLVVSDRDDYLRMAKHVGMITCRVRQNRNAPRGNISAHYNVGSVSEV
eukprot:CAMPEP_0116854080 /NCGR_PEP_ID=MMETSP0418-20121206/18360_1 /TAXON_ID=1158023 /ORGANISM="Astrosyne radiata, Strain 13vi08-1A" /LENGTH=110 /DNA_ID=CAMNT_0004486735 /DNA_START=42 /DNA_END=370 /DNA_ORIENTATION=-